MKTKTYAIDGRIYKMALLLLLFSAVFMYAFAGVAKAETQTIGDIEIDVLTGDTKLACEAILCLSSTTRPGECAPSLNKYYSINAKKMKDTIKKRKNFLSLCPAASEPNMPSLVDAIANGAGYCDAAYLNKQTETYYRLYDYSRKSWSGWKRYDRYNDDTNYPTCGSNPGKYNSWGDENYSRYCQETKSVIKNVAGSSCINLMNHEFTDYQGLRYVGDPFNGGHWIDN